MDNLQNYRTYHNTQLSKVGRFGNQEQKQKGENRTHFNKDRLSLQNNRNMTKTKKNKSKQNIFGDGAKKNTKLVWRFRIMPRQRRKM